MSFPFPKFPLLFVISAPSGSGKTTLCHRLQARFQSIHFSVSCTTRDPRDGEVHGKDYYFIDEDAFQRHIQAGEFLEHAEVYGYRYGTLRKHVLEALEGKKDVLLDIDVQGADQIRAFVAQQDPFSLIRQSFVDVFIAPPSMEELRRRLVQRGHDDEDIINVRLQAAQCELTKVEDYSYVVVNEEIEEAANSLCAIFLAEQHRVRPARVCIS